MIKKGDRVWYITRDKAYIFEAVVNKVMNSCPWCRGGLVVLYIESKDYYLSCSIKEVGKTIFTSEEVARAHVDRG